MFVIVFFSTMFGGKEGEKVRKENNGGKEGKLFFPFFFLALKMNNRGKKGINYG